MTRGQDDDAVAEVVDVLKLVDIARGEELIWCSLSPIRGNEPGSSDEE